MYLFFQGNGTIAGVIDLGTVEIFPVFQSAQRGLIDHDTCYVLLEAQLVRGGLLHPDSPQGLSLEKSLSSGLIDSHIYQSLSEIEAALHLVQESHFTKSHTIPVAAAMEVGCIKEQIGLRVLNLQVSTGGFWDDCNNEMLSLENAKDRGLISAAVYDKLCSCLERQELIDPNTAEKLSLSEFYQRCVLNQETGLRLLPVNQQSRGTICLRSGIKVGIFRAAQEGLIDREVTIRLLEAQLFAGGIPDPRTGHRLTIDEAERHGLMDHDLACALLTHQLQSGGIIDPVTGERLELDESLQRSLLSPRMALRVLESLWAFIGMLWPESGELLPITEALQQGVISGDLARKVLNKRHFLSAIYSPESGELIPLGHAENVLGPEAAKVLQQTRLPDFLHAMTQTRSLHHQGTSFSSPLSCSATASLPRLHSDAFFLEVSRPQEQDFHYLLSYLMTHSYINAHSGERLILLEPELMELINLTGAAKDQNSCKPQLKEPANREEAGEPLFVRSLSETKQENIQMDGEKNLNFSISRKDEQGKQILLEENETYLTDNICRSALMNAVQRAAGVSLKETSTDGTLVKLLDTHSKVSETEPETSPLLAKEVSSFQSSPDTEEKSRREQLGSWLEVEMPPSASEKKMLDENQVECATSVKKLLDIKTDNTAVISKDTVEESQPDGLARKCLQEGNIEVSAVNKQILVQTDTNRSRENADSSKINWTISVSNSEEADLDRMAKEMLQGGLLTVGTQKLLLDEAVNQDLIPVYTAVKLMSKAELFGGFLDVHVCQPLSLDDVMQKSVQDEDLMTKVIKSEKTMAGVFDVEHGRICTLREAAKEGLLDTDTVSRLLEAQIVSGGIIDFVKGKKVSVNVAAKRGLIEEKQKDELLLLEKSCHGKGSDPHVIPTKLKLQLQMNGITDPKTKQPVPLQQALQKGFISHDETEKILLQQVAEGGIVHHGSGIRLSVTDAVHQGIIDDSLALKLKQFEKSRQNQFSSDPDAAFLQATVGFIHDGASDTNLTLTEAASCGVIDQSIVDKVMDSPIVRSGILDPQNACVLPYTDLIKQGKIDIETGWRFLEVRPFRGIPNKENGDLMTVPEAVRTGQVDPIPALRLLQSQADSGGIINISSGEKLPLLDAIDKSLVQKDVAMVIAKNQFLKGGLVGSVSGQRVSSLEEAVQDGLISREMAAELCDHFGLVDPLASQCFAGQDSPTARNCENLEVSTVQLADIEEPQSWTTGHHKDKSEIDTDEQLQVHHHNPSSDLVEQKHVDVSSRVWKDADVSLEVLSQFALKAERRLQEAIEECSPIQHNTVEPEQELKLVQNSQISATVYDVIPQTTKPYIQIQPDAKTGINLENYEKSNVRVVPEIVNKVLDGQVEIEKETNRITVVAELQSVSGTVDESERSTENRSEILISEVIEEQKMQGKRKGRGKHKKQIKVCTESDERSEVQKLDRSMTSQVKGTEVGMEFEVRRTPVVQASSSENTIANEFGREVLGVEEKEVNADVDIRENRVMISTDEAKGSHMNKVSIVQKSEHYLETSDVNAASPGYGVVNVTIEADLGFDQKPSEDNVVKQVTEYKYRTEALVTDKKPKEVDMKGEAQVDLEVTLPIERINTMSEKDADTNERSEGLYIKKGVKIDSEALKASDLNEASLVDNTEDPRKELVAFDQRHVKEVKEWIDIKVDLEVLKEYECATSSIESTENVFGKEIVVTDQRSEDLDVITAADLAEVSFEEDINGKSGTEFFVRDKRVVADMKGQKEDKVDVDVRKTTCMGVTLPIAGMEPMIEKDIVATDQKCVEEKIIREAKVDLKVNTGDKYTKGMSGEDAGDQKYVEEQKEIKMDLDIKLPSIISPAESTKNYDIVTDVRDLEVIKTPDRTEGSPAKHMESRFTKEFVESDQKSVNGEVKIDMLAKAETKGVPDTSDDTESIQESLHQGIENVKSVAVSKQRHHMGNTSLKAEPSKHDPAGLVNVHKKDEFQRQMQSRVINDKSKTQIEHELDVNEDLAPDQSDKKRKKKRKNKKAKIEHAEKESEKSKADEPVQRPPVVLTQSDTLTAERKDGMEQSQKPNQAQLEKDALLMKAKESILRKVFERSVSEKQAAEELEALRQGSAKERHPTAQEKAKLEEKTSSLHTKENETDVKQIKQIDTNLKLLPKYILTGTDSIQTHFSPTDLCDDTFHKKKDLSCTESSDEAIDPSKQISTPIFGLDRQVGEAKTQESVHPKREKLRDSAILKQPYASLTGEDKDHQKSVSKTKDAVPEGTVNRCEQTSKTELEDTISKEPLQSMIKQYSSADDEFKDESSIEESSESRLSYLEEVPESDTTECWEEEDFEQCQEGVDEKQAEDHVTKQRTAAQVSKVRCCVYVNSAIIFALHFN